MKISVITPSYNQAQFLPDNLRTVSSQTGITLEHIIVDPGSTDGSTELARQAHHAILLNEPDRGQSHGITKGFAMSTGDVVTWLNSDDMYPSPDTLAKVAAAFKKNPDADVIYGGVDFVDESGKYLKTGFVNKNGPALLKSFEYQVGIVQPGVFMKREVFEKLGGPSEDYNYCMDYEYWVRIAAAGYKWVFINETLAHHRWWPGMKTASGRGDSLIEHFKVCMTYFNYIHHKWIDRLAEFFANNLDGLINWQKPDENDAKRSKIREIIYQYVTQDALKTLHGSPDKERADTLDYIEKNAPGFVRICFFDDELGKTKRTHPIADAEKRIAWYVFDTKDAVGRAYKSYSVPQNFVRHFDARWFDDQKNHAAERFAQFQRSRREVCVVVANGPSLNKSDLSLLEGTDVIISNFAVISKQLQKYATYLTIVNDLVAKQGSVDFNRLELTKIVPFWLANSINAGDRTVFLNSTVEPVFGTTGSGMISWRSTVSFFNMQVAYAMGYERVVLIGFDHSYQQAAELKEGAAIVQTTEDPNHFDPRYFQGKTWQAADTGNMEKMYVVARDAYAAGGRSIINATVGGKLEVFPRMDLEVAVRPSRNYRVGALPEAAAPAVEDEATRFPKVLVLDMTAMGNGTATGEIKSNLMAQWPQSRVLQVAGRGKDAFALVRRTDDGSYSATPMAPDALRVEIAAFGPEVILYRPVADVPWLHKFSMDMIEKLKVPLVTWVMDDWPSRVAETDPAQAKSLLPDVEALIGQSAQRLSISKAMSESFEERYGVDFTPIANGINPGDWPAPRKHSAGALLVRYSGGLAADMTRDSVLRLARAVESLAGAGMDVRLEINTQKWWIERSGSMFAEFKHTKIGSETLTTEAYRKWLSAADVVVIAYNFDADTLRYVRYSMANKMPECLASGAVLLAIGPSEIATIDYLASTHAAMVINKESDAAIVDALKALKKDPDLRTRLSAAGHEVARTRHNVATLQEQLRSIFVQAARSKVAEAPFAVPDARTSIAVQIELEKMRQNFAAVSRYARDLDRRLGGRTTAPVPLAGGGDLIDQLKAAGPGSARLLLTSVGNAVLMQPDDMANRLEKDATLRAAILTALDALEDTDGHKRQYLRIRQRFVRGQGSEA